MKIKAVLVGLGVLMFIFCSVSLSQAEIDPRHKMNFMAPPNEHPWQESGSPPSDDSIGPDEDSPILIVIGPVKFIMIRPSHAELVPNGNRRVDDSQMERIPDKNTMPKKKNSR